MRDKKNGETRHKKKKLGDETQDKKNGETRLRRKKMGRQDVRQKNRRDETQDKKNGETSSETKISSPKASNGQRFPCPALLSPWFSWGEAGQRP